MRCNILTTGISVLLVAGFVAGCSTPKHTNTLIFGTNTKVALDVSQDPTGSLGITLGYKRHEAVWMPLLPNQASQQADKNGNADLVPATCSGKQCDKFEGSTGTGGGPAGAGANDTYSVLATLSGQTSASGGSGVEAKGGIAQVFATGFAARLLAVQGGAALVNTNSAAVAAADVRAKNASKIIVEDNQIDRIMVSMTDPDGKLNATKAKTLIDKSKLADADKQNLSNFKDAASLRIYIEANFEKIGKPLHDATT